MVCTDHYHHLHRMNWSRISMSKISSKFGTASGPQPQHLHEKPAHAHHTSHEDLNTRSCTRLRQSHHLPPCPFIHVDALLLCLQQVLYHCPRLHCSPATREMLFHCLMLVDCLQSCDSEPPIFELKPQTSTISDTRYRRQAAMSHETTREEHEDLLTMAKTAVAVTESFTRESEDSTLKQQGEELEDLLTIAVTAVAVAESRTQTKANSTSTPAKQVSSKQPVSPFAPSVVRPAPPAEPARPPKLPKSKYRDGIQDGWGTEAFGDFPNNPARPLKRSRQHVANTEASNAETSGVDAGASKPRLEGQDLFRCSPDCVKCSGDTASISQAPPVVVSAANKSPTSSNSSSNSSSSSSLHTLPSTSTSATSLQSLPQRQIPQYTSHLMPIDISNPYIQAETQRIHARQAQELLFTQNIARLTVDMLHLTSRSKQEWEEDVLIMEDEAVDEHGRSVDEDGRKVGWDIDQVWEARRRRGGRLEGTVEAEAWRRRRWRG